MSRYFIEDVKCGYDTCFDCCGPNTTVASAIKYKNDDGKTGWLYCIQPEGYDPMIAFTWRWCLWRNNKGGISWNWLWSR